MGLIRVLVSGAFGRMGRFVCNAVQGADDMELVAAVDPAGAKHPVSVLLNAHAEKLAGQTIWEDLTEAIETIKPDVMVDFTVPAVVMENLQVALSHGVACVVGTTGFSPENLEAVDKLSRANDTACLVAPNFSIGALMMMKFAAEAAKHYGWAEIIEQHHENKVDSPSGTALKTAEMMAAARPEGFGTVDTEVDKAPGSRGGTASGIQVHATRMPGYVADQQVIFGGLGERLTISHVSISRECFMPGVLLGVRQIKQTTGLTYGLEHFI